jgi:HAD superfamily hydrolase (TIGR01509 family)
MNSSPALDPHRFDAVIFDCDGVLVDSEPISARTLVESLGEFGFDIDVAYVYRHYLGRSFATIGPDYERKLGKKLPESFRQHWHDYLFETFRRDLRAIAGVNAVLEHLAVPYAVVSSSAPERLSLCLEVTDLERYFGERIFSSAMVARGKPAPDLFLLAANRLGGDARRMLAIEDSPAGVEAARAAEMTVWGFTGGSHFNEESDGRELIDRGASLVFRDMNRLIAGR